MTALRQRMLEELQRHNYSQETIRLYLFAVKDFARHFKKSPDLLTQEHMREFQLYLLNKRKLTAQTVAGRITALRFFFVKVLRRPYQELDLVYPKRPDRLPTVLSEDEVAKLIESASSAYHRVIITTLYATGMRRAELARLKVEDIDSQRMVIHVRQGMLMLNPGFNPIDYFAEYSVPEFRRALTGMLRQEHISKDFPFIYLNPQFRWHSGAEYWMGRFRPVVEAVCLTHQLKFHDALSWVSQRVACLQYVPYHSMSGLPVGSPRLPSSAAMLNHMRTAVIPAVEKGDVVVIALRQVRTWNLPDLPGIVKYSPMESRSGRLTARAKKKILEQLGIELPASYYA